MEIGIQDREITHKIKQIEAGMYYGNGGFQCPLKNQRK